jgi:hypothetical protein
MRRRLSTAREAAMRARAGAALQQHMDQRLSVSCGRQQKTGCRRPGDLDKTVWASPSRRLRLDRGDVFGERQSGSAGE